MAKRLKDDGSVREKNAIESSDGNDHMGELYGELFKLVSDHDFVQNLFGPDSYNLHTCARAHPPTHTHTHTCMPAWLHICTHKILGCALELILKD
jgi:hypothetical protein